jgi:uncharacterized protein (DUF1501 family)
MRNTACGTLSSFALIQGVEKMFLTSALAQPNGSADYKALVCVFLFGGNDANNIVIPYTHYDGDGTHGYGPERGGTVQLAVPIDRLLQIRPPSDDPNVYGLHPALGSIDGQPNDGIYGLWNQGKVAIAVNTGTMVDPNATKDDLRAGINRPYQLFSHSDQQAAHQSSKSTGVSPTGWAGRVADRVRGLQTFPVVTSISGVQVFSVGATTRPLIAGDSRTRIDRLLLLDRDFHPDNPIDQLVALDRRDGTAMLVRANAEIAQLSLDIRAQLQSAGDPTPVIPFPDTGLGRQLKQVAKLIKTAREFLTGVQRQIFFVSLGGFDTHNNQGAQTGNQANLWIQVSQAMNAFYQATIELGLENNVTQFTMSDFSRTLKPANPGGNVGTDHAWGSHHFAMGGAINPNPGRVSDFYGRFPDLIIGSDADYDAGGGARGRWIPRQSVDQYAYTLAKWFGLQVADRDLVFPNLYRFSPDDLGFMSPPSGAKPTTNAAAADKSGLLKRLLRL